MKFFLMCNDMRLYDFEAIEAEKIQAFISDYFWTCRSISNAAKKIFEHRGNSSATPGVSLHDDVFRPRQG
jgi:hypothetical protein